MACVTKKKGRWCVDFYDQHGRRRLKMLPAGATKTQAKKLLREVEEQVDRRTFLPSEKVLTFAEVAKQWIEHKKPNLRASTWSVYEGHTRNHFQDLDHLKINRISIATVEKYITDRQKEDMHILTLRKVLVTLNQIMTYAARHKYIDYNPVRDAEKPRGQGKTIKKQIRILNPDEINRFLDTVPDPKYSTLFELAIMSGARQGELLALKWSDVDWEKSQVHIRRTFNNGALYAPKTDTSGRQIDIGERMMAQLKKWRVACPPNDLDLLFPNRMGKHINHNNMINRHFHPALKRAGLKRIRFHDLRHTYASLQIKLGESIKYIQTQMGHSSPTVTHNVYAHLLDPTNPAAANRLETLIFENGDQMETQTQKEATV